MKKVLYSEDARNKIADGVRKICKAVKSTLGPGGRNVLISRAEMTTYGTIHAPIHITKDGITVARAFELEDQLEYTGAKLIKEAAQKTVEQAGDSTTTTCVLAEAIMEKGLVAVENGANPVYLKRGMDAAVAEVVKKMKEISIPVKGDNKRIEQVATVSANNDAEIGKMIAEAYARIGENGVIRLEDSKTVYTKVKYTDGLKFDTGLISPDFVNNPAKMTCEFPNMASNMPNKPYVLLFDRPITMLTQIADILNICQKSQRPLLIIAEDFDSEGLALLKINNAKKAIAVALVRAPFYGERRDEAMEEIAILTGATYFSNLKGKKLEKATAEDLGSAEKIIVTKDDVTIIDGDKDESARVELLDKLEKEKAVVETDEEKDRITNRIARLNAAIAVIEVGGNTSVEQLERKDRFDDAVRSVKASLTDGFVPGGGTAMLRCSDAVVVDKDKSSDFQAGQTIIRDILEAPMLQICENAGVKGSDKIVEVLADKCNHVGYNAQTETVENLVDSGIIDATKVLCAALTNAASVAGILLTSECLISDTF